ncbi:flavin reductase family protein [Mixta sp. Marseille-Q2659]|uniref:flavin reductase family protein n=1 Tax=Mixta sp. Marseille-Q2659 TaxID=2736607 RepID=UPI0023B9A8ED|nr:flavin reductase family protein [Mixta sp. Marseille-Q2659]
MAIYNKQNFPVEKVRKYLEPGPVVLVTSQWENQTDIMTLGWHTILEFSPSLLGCMIASMNVSHELIRNSGECVINIPGVDLIDQVVAIGNSHGDETDKFVVNQLTAQPGDVVKAPLIGECFASFECRLHDGALVDNYNFFIFEVVKAHVDPQQERPATLHYTGEGIFRVMGEQILDQHQKFKPEMLI